MNRRKFTNNTIKGAMALPFVTNIEAKRLFSESVPAATKVPLGVDVHSVRAMNWKAKQLIDYVIGLEVDSVLLNGLNYFESLDEAYLKTLKASLDQHNMSLYFGIGGLSVNSPSYSDEFGSPQELILQGIRMARIFETPSVNCKIGSHRDRRTDGGIVARMDELINELRSMRSQIQDAGIKFAVENHAGDMRSEEVLQVVETVGTDICGVMLDPGNAVWTMENPMHQLEKLGKHVLCTSIRDYRIWESEDGATLSWTAIGDGAMDFPKYTQRMSELCPGVPLQIETISNLKLQIPFLKDDYWEGYPDLKAYHLPEFFTMLRDENSFEIPIDTELKGVAAQESQEKELLKSINYLREHCAAIQ
jgi:sugar phosphate isomerase/epimerase